VGSTMLTMPMVKPQLARLGRLVSKTG
jgi:hypothetical protein